MTSPELIDVLVLRDGERDLAFTGAELGHASSKQHDGQPRWFELTIYRTEAGAYVAAGVGHTTVPNEVTKYWAILTDTADDLVRRLEREEKSCAACGSQYRRRAGRGRRGYVCRDCGGEVFRATGTRYLPRTAQLALDDASEHDDAIADAITEEVA